MKKTAAVLLMMIVMLAGCAAAEPLRVTGYETESVTRSWENNLFFSRMEALTGVAVQAAGIAEEKDYLALLESMEKGEDKTDVLFKANLTREQEIRLLESGALIDLAPLIDAHMPNLSALLAAHPQWKEIISLDDGRIASLPLLNEHERQAILWINRAWLENLGLSMPQTLEELTAALEQMIAGDPNRNHAQDETAADLLGVYEMRWLLPYFGIVADDYHLARGEDGTYVFAPELPAYRAFIELLKQWNDKGILGSDAFTGVHSTAILSAGDEKDTTVKSGLILSMTPYTHIPAASTADFEPLLIAGPDGSIRWRDLLGEVWTGCFAVSAHCEDPAAALKWVDALYGEEGALLAYGGVEGEDYQFSGNGKWSFITDSMRDINAIRSEVLMYTGVAMPALYPAEFIFSVDSALDQHVFSASEKVRAVSEQVTPAYALSMADQEKANALAAQLGGMVDRGIARFATGEVELTDENYEAWLEELRGAGSAELTALFQQAQK
ncbi:MAG: hypothetical protein IJN79_08620 [Clostridia bacterium]|nr:hypothetical protein [Clostridia bacterium]